MLGGGGKAHCYNKQNPDETSIKHADTHTYIKNGSIRGKQVAISITNFMCPWEEEKNAEASGVEKQQWMMNTVGDENRPWGPSSQWERRAGAAKNGRTSILHEKDRLDWFEQPGASESL